MWPVLLTHFSGVAYFPDIVWEDKILALYNYLQIVQAEAILFLVVTLGGGVSKMTSSFAKPRYFEGYDFFGAHTSSFSIRDMGK